MRRLHLSALVAALALCATACAGVPGEEGGDAGDDGQICYPNETCNAGLTCEGGICAPEASGGGGVDGGVTTDAWVTDTSQAADTGTPEPGQFGAPCEVDDDCFSALCVGHMGDTVCSKTCEEECPAGWSCEQVLLGGSDPIYLCVSSFEHLCKPCLNADECTSLSSQAACVSYGHEGDFCGAACTEDGDCPSGFVCEQSVSTRGGQSSQCVDVDGVCECSGLAASLGLVTACSATSDLGTCEGLRTCSAEGLSPCDATPPAEETCNGLDDDCDGETDEVDCDDENPCTTDTCAGTDGCAFTPVEGGGECQDGDACTQGDTCVEGLCVGDPIVCDDQNPCTDDTCDPEGGCLHTPNFADCDDGDACTLGDTCKAGGCAPGTALACDDQNPCTDDLCDEALGCDHQPNTATCDDQNACTDGDACAEGLCLGVTAVVCDDQNLCTHDTCSPQSGCVNTPHTLPCDDGSVCTLGDACSEGVCEPGTGALACDDQNPCTDDACDATTGCQHTANSDACDDGSDCTTGDTCDSGACVGEGLLACDDQNPCTTDSCLADGGCAHAHADGPCTDGDLCTVGDTCVEGACTAGAIQGCDDQNPCTDDLCGDDGLCVHTPNTAPCDDDNLCTQTDACQGGVCAGTDPPNCHDSNLCTEDWCDPALGCQNLPNSAPCDDGDACTTSDTCSGGTCDGQVTVTCDDHNVCTDDTCEPAVGCLFAPNTAPCDDGDPCTIDDHCHAGTCVTTAGAIEEVCDGDDNDCDGETDEGLPPVTCGLGQCLHAVVSCVDGIPQDCDPQEGASEEICDGDDNDCDGEADEGLPQLTCGLGACTHTIDNCQGGSPAFCDPMEGATDEVCDGDDNDCDGQVDEGLGETSCGVGACAHTIDNCQDGAPAFCDPFVGATSEVCDGVDNDCDDETDEGLGQTTCGLSGCAHTIDSCSGGTPQVCDPFEGATEETCNDQDDDCDGEVDEGDVCVYAIGGSVVTYTVDGVTYVSHTFTEDGTLSFTTSPASIDVLLVAGGGGGGASTETADMMSTPHPGGGGGAGGMLVTTVAAPGGNYAITVGTGGLGLADGLNSVLSGGPTPGAATTTLTAHGGGRGGRYSVGNPGGSGGGGGAWDELVGTIYPLPGGAGCASGWSGCSEGELGHRGGTGAFPNFGAGGGGAGGPGQDATLNSSCGTGGPGATNDYQTGAQQTYAQGGGGAGCGAGGAIGSGGTAIPCQVPACANVASAGKDGIVVVRYAVGP